MCRPLTLTRVPEHMREAYAQGISYSGDLRWVPNVTGGERSSLNRDSYPEPLAYRASALPTELLRPEIYADFHTPGYPLT